LLTESSPEIVIAMPVVITNFVRKLKVMFRIDLLSVEYVVWILCYKLRPR